MAVSRTTRIADWAQHHAEFGERHVPRSEEPLPVLLTPAIVFAGVTAAQTAAQVGLTAAAGALGYDDHGSTVPSTALDTGRSVGDTLAHHPQRF
ncbi:hypothetical protein [Streptomyces xiaopingdaonensis]|uniref:hypothetical protein n=1 Tax=Streptomyces xiaopingdaonensis TaxID=1565415 RepID=UPI000526D314|nr:hypothetical protein [Streptomyces xiaopingdaonensis]